MRVFDVRVRSTNQRYAFRPGEYARVVDMVGVQHQGKGIALCYAVRYQDGTADYIPVNDPDNPIEVDYLGQPSEVAA